MCIELVCPTVESGTERITTLGEFRAKFGEPVFIHEGRLFADCHCLCTVDCEKTAAKMGLAITVEGLTWRVG